MLEDDIPKRACQRHEGDQQCEKRSAFCRRRNVSGIPYTRTLTKAGAKSKPPTSHKENRNDRVTIVQSTPAPFALASGLHSKQFILSAGLKVDNGRRQAALGDVFEEWR